MKIQYPDKREGYMGVIPVRLDIEPTLTRRVAWWHSLSHRQQDSWPTSQKEDKKQFSLAGKSAVLLFYVYAHSQSQSSVKDSQSLKR